MIDPRLMEKCPEPTAILRFLRTKDCGIKDVQSVEVNGQPCLEFTYDGDGVALSRILDDARYIPVTTEQGRTVKLAYKRKLLDVKAGQTFTVPEGFRPRGKVISKNVGTNYVQEWVKERFDVLLPGNTYAILRMSDNKLPVVLHVDPTRWQEDWRENGVRANAEGLGSEVSFEEMRWVYRSALLGMPDE